MLFSRIRLRGKRKRNVALRILLSTNAFILLSGAMLAPIYAIFVEDIGGDLLDASLTAGVFAFAAGITTLVSGKMSDKIRESELIVVGGYAVMGLGFFLFTQVNSLLSLFLVQALIGIAEAIYSPAFDGLFSKHLDKHKEASEWGMWEAINYGMAAFGALAGGIIVTYFSFSAMFSIMGLLCVASALYIYLLPRKIL